MKLHANHRTCPRSRRLICRRVIEKGWTLEAAAAAAGCSVRTAAKWLARFRAVDGELFDCSSRPRRSPRRLPQLQVLAIERLRRLRMTAAEIAEVLDVPLSIVSLWLKRIGLGRRSRVEPPEPRTATSGAILAGSCMSTSSSWAASPCAALATASSASGAASTRAASMAARRG
jgi:transposase